MGNLDELKPKNSQLLTVVATAALLGISPGTLYHWISQKRDIPPVVRLSARCIRFRQCDVESWITPKVLQVVLAKVMDSLGAPPATSKL